MLIKFSGVQPNFLRTGWRAQHHWLYTCRVTRARCVTCAVSRTGSGGRPPSPDSPPLLSVGP